MTRGCTGPRRRGRTPRTEFNELCFQHLAKHRSRDQGETLREQETSLPLRESRVPWGRADPGTDALSRALKEQGARKPKDNRQGAPDPGRISEGLLEEVSPELQLEGGEEKQEGIPERKGQLEQTRFMHWQGLCRKCRHV